MTTAEIEAQITTQTYPFSLRTLPYAYDALEPFMDAKTVEVHHSKHHQTYINNLNNALKDHPELHQKTLPELLANLDAIPEGIRTAVKNQGGGHLNHDFFWEVLKPAPAGKPSGKLLGAIESAFTSFEQFKKDFDQAVLKLFGSGWVFLIADPNKQNALRIQTTANQDSVITLGVHGLLICDVWEHAYYLKHQNRRPDYLEAYWNLVNWDAVNDRFAQI